jgi:hypothetical protein
MTENARFKHDVRARMAATGEKYTEAARAVRERRPDGDATGGADPTSVPHYAFTPPETIEYVDGAERRTLRVPEGSMGVAFGWGYAGTGPNTSSWALLIDATGSADQVLAIAFTDDNLDWWDEIGDQAFVITREEVTAWRRLNEARVHREHREKAEASRFSDMAERLRASYEEQSRASGPRGPFWAAFREGRVG